MIFTEDADFVRFTFAEGDIAVPISVTKKVGDSECTITVYEPFYEVAATFEKRFSDAPFSDEAIAYLKDNLTAPMLQKGFRTTRDIDSRIRTFLLCRAEDIPTETIRPETRIVSGKDDLSTFTNATTHEIEMDEDDPDDISAIIVENGRLVAYATLNDVFDDEEFLEISVECAVGYRERGYATSCAALLSTELCKRGYNVSYKCRHANAASARVAQKAGFAETSMEYNFVCYRDE